MDSWKQFRGELAGEIRGVLDSFDVVRSLRELPIGSREELRDDLHRLGNLVVSHREPRVVIVGKPDVPLPAVLEALGVSMPFEPVREKLGRGRWYEHESDRGNLLIADLRSDDGAHLRPLEYQRADTVIAVAHSDDEDVEGVAGALIEAMDLTDDHWGAYPPGFVAVLREDGGRSAGDFRTQQAFKDAFTSHGLPRDWVDVISTAREGRLPRRILAELPDDARLTLARLSTDRQVKEDVAYDLIRLAASMNAAIATVPVPVAGMFPITSVQLAMIAGIVYVSGRAMTLRTLGEFGTAMGLNVSAGFALRELARALVQWIPVAGPVVSASIAAGATFTIGKAAVRYFLDE